MFKNSSWLYYIINRANSLLVKEIVNGTAIKGQFQN